MKPQQNWDKVPEKRSGARGKRLASLPVRPFEERQNTASEAKRTIAGHIIQLIAGAQSVAFDASSTVFAMSEFLVPGAFNEGLFVVTFGLPIFNELRQKPGIHIAISGGEPHPVTGALVGPMALASVKSQRYDWAVLSAMGYMENDGSVYEVNAEEAAIKRIILANSKRAILAIDKSKLNFSSPYKMASLKDFDALVNDDGVVWLKQLKNSKRTR